MAEGDAFDSGRVNPALMRALDAYITQAEAAPAATPDDTGKTKLKRALRSEAAEFDAAVRRIDELGVELGQAERARKRLSDAQRRLLERIDKGAPATSSGEPRGGVRSTSRERKTVEVLERQGLIAKATGATGFQMTERGSGVLDPSRVREDIARQRAYVTEIQQRVQDLVRQAGITEDAVTRTITQGAERVEQKKRQADRQRSRPVTSPSGKLKATLSRTELKARADELEKSIKEQEAQLTRFNRRMTGSDQRMLSPLRDELTGIRAMLGDEGATSRGNTMVQMLAGAQARYERGRLHLKRLNEERERFAAEIRDAGGHQTEVGQRLSRESYTRPDMKTGSAGEPAFQLQSDITRDRKMVSELKGRLADVLRHVEGAAGHIDSTRTAARQAGRSGFESDVVDLQRQVSDYRSQNAPGAMRLFRGEGIARTPGQEWDDAPAGAGATAGRWFTDDVERAKQYARRAGEGFVKFVDVTADVAEQWRLAESEAAVAKRGATFVVPDDVAARAAELEPGSQAAAQAAYEERRRRVDSGEAERLRTRRSAARVAVEGRGLTTDFERLGDAMRRLAATDALDFFDDLQRHEVGFASRTGAEGVLPRYGADQLERFDFGRARRPGVGESFFSNFFPPVHESRANQSTLFSGVGQNIGREAGRELGRLYHVGPIAGRESIAQRGLRVQPGGFPDVYLFKDLEAARGYAEMKAKRHGEPSELYDVDPRGVSVRGDPNAGYAVRSGPIDPEHLRLLDAETEALDKNTEARRKSAAAPPAPPPPPPRPTAAGGFDDDPIERWSKERRAAAERELRTSTASFGHDEMAKPGAPPTRTELDAWRTFSDDALRLERSQVMEDLAYQMGRGTADPATQANLRGINHVLQEREKMPLSDAAPAKVQRTLADVDRELDRAIDHRVLAHRARAAKLISVAEYKRRLAESREAEDRLEQERKPLTRSPLSRAGEVVAMDLEPNDPERKPRFVEGFREDLRKAGMSLENLTPYQGALRGDGPGATVQQQAHAIYSEVLRAGTGVFPKNASLQARTDFTGTGGRTVEGPVVQGYFSSSSMDAVERNRKAFEELTERVRGLGLEVQGTPTSFQITRPGQSFMAGVESGRNPDLDTKFTRDLDAIARRHSPTSEGAQLADDLARRLRTRGAQVGVHTFPEHAAALGLQEFPGAFTGTAKQSTERIPARILTVDQPITTEKGVQGHPSGVTQLKITDEGQVIAGQNAVSKRQLNQLVDSYTAVQAAAEDEAQAVEQAEERKADKTRRGAENTKKALDEARRAREQSAEGAALGGDPRFEDKLPPDVVEALQRHRNAADDLDRLIEQGQAPSLDSPDVEEYLRREAADLERSRRERADAGEQVPPPLPPKPPPPPPEPPAGGPIHQASQELVPRTLANAGILSPAEEARLRHSADTLEEYRLARQQLAGPLFGEQAYGDAGRQRVGGPRQLMEESTPAGLRAPNRVEAARLAEERSRQELEQARKALDKLRRQDNIGDDELLAARDRVDSAKQVRDAAIDFRKKIETGWNAEVAAARESAQAHVQQARTLEENAAAARARRGTGVTAGMELVRYQPQPVLPDLRQHVPAGDLATQAEVEARRQERLARRRAAAPGGVPVTPVAMPEVRGMDWDEFGARLGQANRIVASTDGELQRLARAHATAADQMHRHGLLTTEFLEAMRQGRTSIAEIGTQMGGTLLKFGGWTAAAAATYAGLAAIAQVGTGAIESSQGITSLQRVVNNLDTDKAREEFRSLADQFNLPIGQVTGASYEAAKVFKDQEDQAKAVSAALYGVKIGELDPAEASRYVTAVARGFNLGADDLERVIDRVNTLQNQFGADFGETLRGTAAAAGTFGAAGGNQTELSALVATGSLRTGKTGQEIATALRRTAEIVKRPERRTRIIDLLGIDPRDHSITDVIEAAMERVARGGDPTETALAITTPELASGRIIPILQAQQLYRNMLNATAGDAAAGSAKRERDVLLGGAREQIARLNVQLQELGSSLEQSGALSGLAAMVGSLNGALGASRSLLGIFNLLPAPLREAGALATQFLAVGALLRRFDVGGYLNQTGFGRRSGLGNALARNPAARRRGEIFQGIQDEREFIIPERQRVTREEARLKRLEDAQAQIVQRRGGDLRDAENALQQRHATGGTTEADAKEIQDAVDRRDDSQRRFTGASNRLSDIEERRADLAVESADLAERQRSLDESENEFRRRSTRRALGTAYTEEDVDAEARRTGLLYSSDIGTVRPNAVDPTELTGVADARARERATMRDPEARRQARYWLRRYQLEEARGRAARLLDRFRSDGGALAVPLEGIGTALENRRENIELRRTAVGHGALDDPAARRVREQARAELARRAAAGQTLGGFLQSTDNAFGRFLASEREGLARLNQRRAGLQRAAGGLAGLIPRGGASIASFLDEMATNRRLRRLAVGHGDLDDPAARNIRERARTVLGQREGRGVGTISGALRNFRDRTGVALVNAQARAAEIAATGAQRGIEQAGRALGGLNGALRSSGRGLRNLGSSFASIGRGAGGLIAAVGSALGPIDAAIIGGLVLDGIRRSVQGNQDKNRERRVDYRKIPLTANLNDAQGQIDKARRQLERDHDSAGNLLERGVDLVVNTTRAGFGFDVPGARGTVGKPLTPSEVRAQQDLDLRQDEVDELRRRSADGKSGFTRSQIQQRFKDNLRAGMAPQKAMEQAFEEADNARGLLLAQIRQDPKGKVKAVADILAFKESIRNQTDAAAGLSTGFSAALLEASQMIAALPVRIRTRGLSRRDVGQVGREIAGQRRQLALTNDPKQAQEILNTIGQLQQPAEEELTRIFQQQSTNASPARQRVLRRNYFRDLARLRTDPINQAIRQTFTRNDDLTKELGQAQDVQVPPGVADRHAAIVERKSHIKDIKDRITTNRTARARLRRQLRVEEADLKALREEQDRAAAQEASARFDARTAVESGRQGAGLPRLRYELGRASQKVAEALKRFGENSTEYLTAIQQQQQLQAQRVQFEMTRIQSIARYNAALAGSPRGEFLANIGGLNQQLQHAVAHPKQYDENDIRDIRTNIAEAQKAERQRLRQEALDLIDATAERDQARSDNSLTDLKIAARAAHQRLDAGGFDSEAERRRAQAGAINADKAVQTEKVRRQGETLDFRLSVDKITSDQWIAGQNKLLRQMKKGSDEWVAKKREIEKFKFDQNEGQGDNDLMFGNIRMPTTAEIRRFRGGRGSMQGPVTNNKNTVIVNVAPGGDVDKVYDALDSVGLTVKTKARTKRPG